MRVLFVLENYLPHIGGVEVVFKNLCEGLAAKGHDVTVVTHRLPKTKSYEIMNGVRVIRVHCFDSRYLFTFAGIPAALRNAKDADIIHTTTYNGAFPAWVAAAIRRKPAVITVHETWLGKWRHYSNFSTLGVWMHEVLEWLVYNIPRFDRYICVSESTRKMLTQALPKRAKRIITIHNGFHKSKGSWKKEGQAIIKRYKLQDKFVLLAAGRPGTTKGFEYLVDAFPLVKKSIPNAVLLLILSKDAQYRHKVDEFKKKAHKDIIFIEPQPHDKLNAYREAADCVVVPSITEGFGYAVLEAAASGKPLVATDTTSIPEVIYGKHVLVKPKSAKALADGIIKIKNGKYKITPEKSFPWATTVANYEQIYKELR